MKKLILCKKIFFTWLDKWNFPFLKIWGFFSPIKKKFTWLDTWIFFFHQQFFFPCFTIKKNFLNFFHSTWHMKKKFTVTHIKEHFISKQSYYLQKPWEGRELLFLHKKKNFHVLSCTKMIFSLKKKSFSWEWKWKCFLPSFSHMKRTF